jgi:hypothetical protein
VFKNGGTVLGLMTCEDFCCHLKMEVAFFLSFQMFQWVGEPFQSQVWAVVPSFIFGSF